METVVCVYTNSINFYSPKGTTTEAFWDEVDARIKHLCRELAEELSRKYSVKIIAQVGLPAVRE